MTAVEPNTIGLSDEAHKKLTRLKEDGHVREMVDAYRLGIGIALARGVEPPEISGSRTTIFSVATLDSEQLLKTSIQSVYSEQLAGGSVYKFAERLAEWGVTELHRQVASHGAIDTDTLLGGTKSDSSSE